MNPTNTIVRMIYHIVNLIIGFEGYIFKKYVLSFDNIILNKIFYYIYFFTIFILFKMLMTNMILLIYDKNILTDNFNFPSHYCDLKLKPL